MSNKHDVKIAEIHARSESYSSSIGLARLVIIMIWVLSAIATFMMGLQGVVTAAQGELSGLAKVVEAFHLADILHFGLDGVLAITTVVSGLSARRAIKKKNEYQKIAEAADPERSSSGLAPGGVTPK